jgi:hypothetical protein
MGMMAMSTAMIVSTMSAHFCFKFRLGSRFRGWFRGRFRGRFRGGFRSCRFGFCSELRFRLRHCGSLWFRT